MRQPQVKAVRLPRQSETRSSKTWLFDAEAGQPRESNSKRETNCKSELVWSSAFTCRYLYVLLYVWVHIHTYMPLLCMSNKSTFIYLFVRAHIVTYCHEQCKCKRPRPSYMHSCVQQGWGCIFADARILRMSAKMHGGIAHACMRARVQSV